MKSICGINCDACNFKSACKGCVETEGKPFGGTCVLAECHKKGGDLCAYKKKVMEEFNRLGIPYMEEVTELYSLAGSFVNLAYPLSNGQTVQFLDDRAVYLGTQLKKEGTDRCYGLVADDRYLLVCEYGENGKDPEVIVYRKRGTQE